MKKFLLLVLILTFSQTEAMSTTSASTITFCSDKSFKCAPTALQIFDFGTSSKKFATPREGVRIKPENANYTLFPKKLNFTVKGRNILVVSRYWQTGCLYDEMGNLMNLGTSTDRFICMQTATGKKDLPTELGLYNIQTKYKKDYQSTKYSTTGEITEEDKLKNPGKNLGAPMPWAMHFGRIIGKLPEEVLLYDFSDGSALHERQTVNKYGSVSFVSHGCIAVEKGKGQFLQSRMNYGDLILVIDNTFPNNLDEAISINK